ncbi:MAG: hypothetical protein KGZ57_11155 [Dethiobacter sp.]|nr:hypothetical protein [Dethiobacter sp.]MCL5982744.1 hypothetical protein [Bacillota bacterium]
MGKRMFVVEARRLLPLLFLLVLLVSLSIYDTFRTSPTVAPREVATGNEVNFTIADKGERKERPIFRLAEDPEGWAEVANAWGIALPQYPFQPRHEVALFALHAEVQDVQVAATGEQDLEVRVKVGTKRDHFQVVMLPVKDVLLESGQTTWTFADRRGAVLEQFTVGGKEEAAAEQVPKK